MKKLIKTSAKRALDYLAIKVAEKLQPHPEPSSNQVKILTDFGHYLHELRSICLSQMPKGAKNICSVGCASAYYFCWVEEEYGKIEKHTGVEFFAPKPDDLPENVEWLARTAGDLSPIPDNSQDMVISGQNLEHLPLEDALGFLEHAWRILKPGGWLIMDSPNGDITHPINWNHPEHVAEYSLEDIRKILPLAGFEIINEKGLINMRNANGKINKTLPPMDWEHGKGNCLRNAVCGINDPENAFVWWIEAQKMSPGVFKDGNNALKETLTEIYERRKQERLNRFTPINGATIKNNSLYMNKGSEGNIAYGPFAPLFKGSYTLEFEILADDLPDENLKILEFTITDNSDEMIISKMYFKDNFKGNKLEVNIPLNLSKTHFGCNLNFVSTGKCNLEVPLKIKEV